MNLHHFGSIRSGAFFKIVLKNQFFLIKPKNNFKKMKIMFDSSIPREETMKMKDGLELGLLNK